jgi:hypothetical protein
VRLHEQVRYLKQQLEFKATTIAIIEAYVRSEKFDKDNMCNVGDILLRLRERQSEELETFTE